MAYKINNPAHYESIEVVITKEKYPILFQQKVECLMQSGLTREEAESEVEGCELELELCYEIGSGLFAIESDAIESCGSSLYSPYSGEHLEDYDLDEDED